MDPLNVIVSFDGDTIGQKVGRATFTDDVEEVRRVDQGIQRGNEVFRSWALRHAGSVIELGGDEGRIEVPAAALAELPDIRRAYETAVGATVSVGVGRKLSESAKALLVAKRRGKDRVVLYDPGVESEFAAASAEAEAKPEAQKLGEEYLGKSAAHAKPAPPSRQHGEHSEGEVARNADAKPVVTETTHSGRDAVARAHRAASLQEGRDRATAARSSGELAEMRGQVAAALNAMREQLPVMAQLKSAYPQTFKAVQSLVQSVISMGRALQQADTTLAKHERRPKVWSEGDGWGGGVKIPSADHPNRPAYDASYRDAVATQLANGDRKALRPVVVKVADLEGGNTLGVRNPARAKLYEKMLRAGDIVPPVVVRRTAAGKWELIDGTHRKAGALAAGRAELPGLELMTHKSEPEVGEPLEKKGVAMAIARAVNAADRSIAAPGMKIRQANKDSAHYDRRHQIYNEGEQVMVHPQPGSHIVDVATASGEPRHLGMSADKQWVYPFRGATPTGRGIDSGGINWADSRAGSTFGGIVSDDEIKALQGPQPGWIHRGQLYINSDPVHAEAEEEAGLFKMPHFGRQATQKGELPTHAPERMVALPTGTTHNGKIKVQHADGTTSWKGVRAGMIQGLEADAPGVGANSHPVSSREPSSR